MTDIRSTRGLVATISLTGSVTYQFSQCFSEMRSYNETKLEHRSIEYRQQPGVLVEAARDEVVAHALQQNYDWILQIDADATFPPTTLHQLLKDAYVREPDAGVVGAYSQLKPPPHLPTIDTGSGTWEEHYPGEGLLPVIRTGCHCFLAKTGVFRKLGKPWFRTRLAVNPVRAMMEVDNFCRQRYSGFNPFCQHPEWEPTMLAASAASGPHDTPVGEDSSFFDRCRAAWVPIFVDTDLVTGHVRNDIIRPDAFIRNVRQNREMQRTALGIA